MIRFLLLAIRNVSRNRRRSAITLLAILVGVTAVVMLKGFITGFANLMVEDAVEGRIGAIQIHLAGSKGSLDASQTDHHFAYSEELVKKIAAVPGVRGVAPRVMFKGLVSNGRSQAMFVGRGIDPVLEAVACARAGQDVTEGRRLGKGDHPVMLTGYELAEGFGVKTQDQLKAAPPEQAAQWRDLLTLSSSSPDGRANAVDATLVGTTKSGLAFENKRVVTVPLVLAQELLGLQGHITEYAVGIHDIRKVHQVAKAVQAAVGPGYEVQTWEEVQPFLRDVIQIQAVALGLTSTILFIIVLTGIINTMLMSVFERVREIGTMLAFGVRRRQVLLLFILESGVLGVLGAVGGAICGRLVVAAFARQGIRLAVVAGKDNVLRPAVMPSFILWAMLFAVVGAMVSALYPAWKASRQNPVDALRSI